MTHTNSLVTSALAAVVALGLSGTAHAEKKTDGEKCYGVAKSGKNDCKTLTSACAGHSTSDGQKDAFIVLPKGTCERIAGGTLNAPKGSGE